MDIEIGGRTFSNLAKINVLLEKTKVAKVHYSVCLNKISDNCQTLASRVTSLRSAAEN